MQARRAVGCGPQNYLPDPAAADQRSPAAFKGLHHAYHFSPTSRATCCRLARPDEARAPNLFSCVKRPQLCGRGDEVGSFAAESLYASFGEYRQWCGFPSLRKACWRDWVCVCCLRHQKTPAATRPSGYLPIKPSEQPRLSDIARSASHATGRPTEGIAPRRAVSQRRWAPTTIRESERSGRVAHVKEGAGEMDPIQSP